MKKLVAILLSLMMLAGTAAFAEEHLANYYNPPAINEGQYPIAEKDVKLTYWMPINAGAAQFIANYDENPSYQKAQADTGVDIEFIHPASGNDKEAFGLLTNVPEKMPDMIQMTQSAWYNGGLEAMYNDGLIIDITPARPTRTARCSASGRSPMPTRCPTTASTSTRPGWTRPA